MGYPKTLKEENIEEDDYEYGLEQTYYQMKSTNKQDTLDDYTYIKIQTNKNKDIADQGNFKGRGYRIYEKEAKLENEELKYTYKYGAKGNQKTPIVYNEQIVGMTLLGEVEKTDKEEVKVNLRIDKGKKGLYPYPFRPETGNMLYNMPQKGTTVSLYMPNHDERFAMIINSIRQNTSQDMTDPSKRTFTTEHGKKLDLYKDQMKLKSKTTGTKVGLADEDTIFIKSHKNINIIAKEEILLKAKEINIDAKEELNLIKGDALSGTVESSITQSIEIDKKAKDKTKITGTKKEEYAPIQDAPPEEKFDGAKVFGNVVAGLAVVGLVTISTAAIVVATGGSAAIIAGTFLGGAISVGMTAISDKIKNKVSSVNEYMLNGFTGAVTGAISGSIDEVKKLKEGTKLALEAVSGFIIGTGEDAARQVLLEGKKEVDPIRSVINGIMNAGLAIAVPVLIKGGKAVVNKIKTPGVNKSVGEVAEDVIGKGFKETSEDVIEEVAEKGTKTLVNNVDDVISDGFSKNSGIVWDNIKITQPMYNGTKIPKSFELIVNGEKYWVHPNGTKHMVEYITQGSISHGIPINSQTLLTSFKNSVSGAVKQGIKYEEIMSIGNWELIFSKPRENGLLPVIKHAVYKP